MDAVSTLVLSEFERLTEVKSIAIYGTPSPGLAQALTAPVSEHETETLLRGFNETSTPSDYVIYLHDHDTDLSELERRTVAHRLTAVTARVLLVVAPLGAELPMPLIEVKRGLLLNSGHQGYRVFGRRS